MIKNSEINGNKVDFTTAGIGQLKKLPSERLRYGLSKLVGKTKKIREQIRVINKLLLGGVEVFTITDVRTKVETIIIRESEGKKKFTVIHRSLCGDVEHDFSDESYDEAVDVAKWIGTS